MSTRKTRIEIEPLALLLYALGYFFDSSGLFAALLPAVLAHELGHLLLLRIGGMSVRSVRVGLVGLEIDYFGLLGGTHGILTILAGPVFGLAYALGAACLRGEYWLLSSGLSLVLSFFNLLPVLPLDGGRLLLQLFPQKGRGLSCLFALCLVLLAFILCLRLKSFSLLVVAVWLLGRNIFEFF